MDHIRRVVIGLGSNLGDRAGSIDGAVAALRADPDLHVMKVSALYETAPEDGATGGPYLNGAVLVLTALDADTILARLHAIEAALGRTRTEPGAPRTIDLDILWIEGESVGKPGLTVPHPRLTSRAFALRPLIELAPDAGDSESGTVYATLPLAGTELTRVRDGD